jgi:phosphatidate phosphatase APP1
MMAQAGNSPHAARRRGPRFALLAPIALQSVCRHGNDGMTMRPEIRSALIGLDAFVSEAQRQARRTLGRVENVRLVPYRGWVTTDKAVVIGRAVLADVALEERLLRGPRLFRVAYERFGTLETAPVEVQVAWQAQVASIWSDRGGFIDVSFPLRDQAPTGVTRAELTVADPAGPRTTSADVFGLHPRAAFGVISDIDDTVLETELTNPWKRALQLIYSQQRMRLPFDGIAALYQALSQPHNPIFYVSNAPWNLYTHVVELLDHHDIPKGPLLLRDSRIGERVVLDEPSGRVIVHKQRALRRIVEDHPKLSFVLIGDSSRRDPLRYIEVAEAHPGRVAAIYIRRVHGVLARRGSLEQLKERAARAGVELLVAEDTVSIAQHAKSRGFVQPAEVGRVREGKRRDELAPPTELTSVAAEPGKEPQ